MLVGENDRSLLRTPARIAFPVPVARAAEKVDFAFALFHEGLHGWRQKRRNQHVLRVDCFTAEIFKLVFENIFALRMLQWFALLATLELNR
jgi:hypothetical protein